MDLTDSYLVNNHYGHLSKSNNVGTQRAMINGFLKRSPICQFNLVNLKHSMYVKGIEERVKSPFEINQRDALLCGPAAFFVCLIDRDPKMYARLVGVW